jgi:hypothetical protein
LADTNDYNYDITPLFKTSGDEKNSESFGVVSSEEISSGIIKENPRTDMKGPFCLGYAVRRIPRDPKSGLRESRLVVFGSTDFIINKFLANIMGANSDIVLNSIDFLLKREGDITIRPKSSNITAIQISSQAGRFLAIFAFAVPIIYLIPGIFVIISRRRKVKV